MKTLKKLFDNNRSWSDEMKKSDPDFFNSLKNQQTPEYLWIGCADSRVPATQITNLKPGEIFVHRNVANLVIHTDFNCLSVLQFAVEVLKVKHIIVCGHYGCGGVQAALKNSELGLIDNWLRHIRDTYNRYQTEFNNLTDDDIKLDRLCELNVVEQVHNVCQTTILHNAWNQGLQINVHGWIYGLDNGLLNDLKVTSSSVNEAEELYRQATKKIIY